MKNETLKSFANKLNKYVTAFSNNVYVKTIASGMMRLLPVTMVASFATLLIGIPFKPFLALVAKLGLTPYLTLVVTLTNGLISIYLVMFLSYEMARLFKKNPINAIGIAVLSFMIVTPLTTIMVNEKATQVLTLTNLGSRGMFVGMIVALLSTRLYIFFIDKGIKIKMHKSVPTAISSTFEALFSVALVALIFMGISALFASTSYGDIHNFVYTILQKPLEGLSGSLGTMLLIVLIGEGFWWFGIHGSSITSAITATLYTPLAIANATALATGAELPHILNTFFLSVYKGPRHLALALMLLLWAKSRSLKSVGKVSVVPGAFGISEPMKYGIPMIFNPLMLIPMALAPVVSIIIAYFATIIGFLPRVGINLPFTMPPFISGLLAGGIPGVVIQIIQFVAIILIYLPFFKAMDKQKCAEEEALALEEGVTE